MKKGERTRSHICRTALALFARHGLRGTTVRMIAEAADVNVAAISGYFGSKEGLYEAALGAGLERLQERRRAALDALLAAGPPSVEALVDAFLDPLHALWSSRDPADRATLGVLSRSMIEDDPVYRRLLAGGAGRTIDAFVQALDEAVPGLGADEIERRLEFAIGAANQAFMDPNRRNARRRTSRARLLASLRSFLVGGLRAPAAPRGRR